MIGINEVFLYELLKACFRNKAMLEMCSQHLKYQYIPIEEIKEVWKAIDTFWRLNKELPTYGVISQDYQYPKRNESEERLRKKVLDVIIKIKETSPQNHDILRNRLEEYIKDSKGVEFHENYAKLYKEGKRDKAKDLLLKTAEELSVFSISKNTSELEKIFSNFKNRQLERTLRYDIGITDIKVPFGIDYIDRYTKGGMVEGDSACFVLRSGVGKSTYLRSFAVNAARCGFPGLFISAEEVTDKVLRKIDAAWTAVNFNDLLYFADKISEKEFDDLVKIAQQIVEDGGEISVRCYEEKGKCKTSDIREYVILYEKENGVYPKWVAVDFLEKLNPSKGNVYSPEEERFRRLDIGEELTNIGVEFKTRIITTTQADSVPAESYNNPDYYMTRNNSSECKSLHHPFSFFFTGNQTDDEYKVGLMRIFGDKIRDTKAHWLIKIYTAFNHGKFYDRKRTLEEIYNEKI